MEENTSIGVNPQEPIPSRFRYKMATMSSGPNHRPPGIHDIARALGISIGTVDRALHNRPGISPKTRDRVLKTAEKLNYQPNAAARLLKLGRGLRIGIYLPREISYFFDVLRDGIRAAADAAGRQVVLDFHTYPRLGEGDIEAIQASDWRQFDGLILAPAGVDTLGDFTRAAVQAGKVVTFVATDAARLPRRISVATDSMISGGIAAELLGHLAREQGSVALFTGSLRVEDHAEKLRGFAGTLATLATHLTLLPVVETYESPEKAYRSAVSVLTTRKDLCGIYINTANSLGVLKAIREFRGKRKITVIATDLFPELASAIEDGYVAASLYQRPFTQGRLAFEALRHCLEGNPFQQITRLAPHIVLRSNLPLFSNTLERDEIVS